MPIKITTKMKKRVLFILTAMLIVFMFGFCVSASYTQHVDPSGTLDVTDSRWGVASNCTVKYKQLDFPHHAAIAYLSSSQNTYSLRSEKAEMSYWAKASLTKPGVLYGSGWCVHYNY
jgi:hypothetical protein